MKNLFKKQWFRFVVIVAAFMLVGGLLRGLYHYSPAIASFVQHSWFIDAWYRVIIWPASFLLKMSGVRHEVAYSASAAQYYLDIQPTHYWLFLWIPCLGVSLMYAYAALVIAFPGSLKRKLWFIIPGWIGIQLLNIIRFYSVAMVLAHDSSGKDYLARNSWFVLRHEDLFNWIVIVLIFLMFVWYTRKKTPTV